MYNMLTYKAILNDVGTAVDNINDNLFLLRSEHGENGMSSRTILHATAIDADLETLTEKIKILQEYIKENS